MVARMLYPMATAMAYLVRLCSARRLLVRSGIYDRENFDIPLSFWMRAAMNTKAKKPAARVSNKENIKTPRRAGRQHRKWARDISEYSSKGDKGR